MKNLIKSVANALGYTISRKNSVIQPTPQAFVLNIGAYQNQDGSFNYEKYKFIQTAGNKNKINNTWVIEDNIAFLSSYIKKNNPRPAFGICHGTRRGKEQEWFMKNLDGCEVIGTEISDTAKDFPHTIQWDFHDIKPEWLGNVDFIYSNSFDHSYDPEKCINTWLSCLKEDGICILEHSNYHSPEGVDELDPFGAEITIMPYLILNWTKSRFAVVDILDAPVFKDSVKYIKFLIIKKV